MADDIENFDELDDLLSDGGADLGLDDPTMNPDEPSNSVVNDFGNALKEETSASIVADKLKESLKTALPADMGTVISNGEDITSKLLEDVEETIKPIKKEATNLLGNVADILPDSMAGPVNRLKEYLSEDTEASSSEESEDEKIKSEVDQLMNKEELLASINQQAENKVQELLAKKETEILATIAGLLEKQITYKSESVSYTHLTLPTKA